MNPWAGADREEAEVQHVKQDATSADRDRSEVVDVLRDEVLWLRRQLAELGAALNSRVEAVHVPIGVPLTSTSEPAPAVELYLNLLKRCLTRTLYDDDQSIDFKSGEIKQRVGRARALGRDWPSEAETMIGLRRLDNIQDCVTDVLHRGVPGDLVETGVWRGGATILMRAILAAYGCEDRLVWAADSFEGLPRPDPERYPADAGSGLYRKEALAVGLDEVQANFARYRLLDDKVRFLQGWFRDTLPTAPIDRIAVLRLDGDMYESTIVALNALYPKLSIGGYLIVDDYYAVTQCRLAVTDYRTANRVEAPLQEIDRAGVFWRREQ